MADKKTQQTLDKRFLEGKITTMYYPEILDGIVELKSRKDKILALRNNATYGLMTFLKYVFDPTIQFSMTGKEVRNIPVRSELTEDNDFDMAENTLKREYQNMSVIVDPSTPLDAQKDFLEIWFSTFHPKETALVYQMFDRKLSGYPGITAKLIQEAYPNLMEKG